MRPRLGVKPHRGAREWGGGGGGGAERDQPPEGNNGLEPMIQSMKTLQPDELYGLDDGPL